LTSGTVTIATPRNVNWRTSLAGIASSMSFWMRIAGTTDNDEMTMIVARVPSRPRA
jgi:hypothetical protein